jgi:hypothetical protein
VVAVARRRSLRIRRATATAPSRCWSTIYGDFTAHVYDRDGRPTDEHPVRKITQNGRTYAEVRLPGGYSAAIVRAKR